MPPMRSSTSRAASRLVMPRTSWRGETSTMSIPTTVQRPVTAFSSPDACQ